MCLGLCVKCEKGIGFSSPYSSLSRDQLIEERKTLGGVPVFKRIVLNPKEIKHSVIPSERDSPILPAGIFLSPI